MMVTSHLQKKINTLIINAKLRPHSLLIHLTFMDLGEGVDLPSWEYFVPPRCTLYLVALPT